MILQHPFGLYLHIPFCKKKCAYCDFFSVEESDQAEAHTDAMEREIAATTEELTYKSVDTLFIGGGTPSHLPVTLLSRIMKSVRTRFNLASDAEMTLECNPGTLTSDKVRAYRDMGFTRISLGAQSFDDKELKFLGRIHDATQIHDAVRMFKEAGFANFNLDLIFGIPGQTLHNLVTNIRTAIDLGASHISFYGLTIEPETALHKRHLAGEFNRVNEEVYEAQFLTAHAHLCGADFVHYEVSNFARPGREALHNLNVWRGRDYYGFGAGAHSRVGVRQWANASDIRGYIENPAHKSFYETPGTDQIRLERLMLGLRTNEGIPVGLCGSPDNITILKQRQLLIEKNGRVILTAEGMLLLDEIVLLLEGRRCLTLN